MALPKIKIDVNAVGFGRITIDGHPLTCVRGFNIRCEPAIPRLVVVTLELIGNVEIEAEPSVINAELLGVPLTILGGPPRKP